MSRSTTKLISSPVHPAKIDQPNHSFGMVCNRYPQMPALVAQLDAHPTGNQEVAGSTPIGSATFFHGD